ncbi:hypothetical protein, partial [Bacillus thuringiensis]|uniref:hypothetical protein n=1 Tax=Bacillus thuringiensis TaxID=1428 RepID=UPI001C38AB66
VEGLPSVILVTVEPHILPDTPFSKSFHKLARETSANALVSPINKIPSNKGATNKNFFIRIFHLLHANKVHSLRHLVS